MKRIVALLVAMVMVLSTASVFATDGLWQGFYDACNTKITSGNLKMNASINLDGMFWEMLEVPTGRLATVDYDFNVISNEEQTKCEADGEMSISSPMLMPEPLGLEMWLKEDITDISNPQFYIIMRMAEALSTELGENKEYIFIDYTQIPGFEELIQIVYSLDESELEALGQMILDALKESFGEDVIARFEQGLKGALNEFKIEYDGSKYIVSAGDAQLKQIFVELFYMLIDIAAEIPDAGVTPQDIVDARAVVDIIAQVLSRVQLFDPERAIVLEVSADGTYVHSEVNISTNIYDIVAAIDPSMASGAEDLRDYYGLGASIKADAYVTPLPADYKIDFPELTAYNTYDVTAEMFADSADVYYEESADVSIEYNGTVVKLENIPVMCQDRTFVPLRELANTFGISDADIHYDEATEKVTIKSGDVEIVMHIGSTVAFVNNEVKTFDVPAFTHNDRTYIPVRFVSEMFKKNVDYIDLNATGQGTGLVVIIND